MILVLLSNKLEILLCKFRVSIGHIQLQSVQWALFRPTWSMWANSSPNGERRIDCLLCYIILEPNATLLRGGAGSGGSRQWEGTVTLIGVALCVVIVACTVAFVCHHRITHRKDKTKQIAANQALLVNGNLRGSSLSFFYYHI